MGGGGGGGGGGGVLRLVEFLARSIMSTGNYLFYWDRLDSGQGHWPIGSMRVTIPLSFQLWKAWNELAATYCDHID